MCRLYHSVVKMTSQEHIKAKIIDGIKMSSAIKNDLKNDIKKWISEGHKRPQLITILVGYNPASEIYVTHKLKAAEFVGILSKKIQLSEDTSELHLVDLLKNLNKDPDVDGILVQLPLPKHINERTICNIIAPNKDVDGFHIENIGKLALNTDTFVPCAPLAVYEILRRLKIDTFGKHIVVCGRSKSVGLPISLLTHSDRQKYEDNTYLSGLEATTTICHRNTPPDTLKQLSRMADIIVTATGVPNLITADMVKDGACVIDVGITRIKLPNNKTKLVGDVDFENVMKVAGWITPVPGGVGPLTVAMLMKNTFKAAKMNEKLLLK